MHRVKRVRWTMVPPSIEEETGEMDFDTALSLAGNYGRFQKLLVFVFTATIMVFGSMSYWTQIFILLVPDHHCQLPVGRMNSTDFFEVGKCGFYPSDDAYPEISEDPYETIVPARGFPYLSLDDLKDDSNMTRSNAVSHCTHGWKYDFSVISSTASSQNNWVCDDSWKVSFGHSVYWFGSMIGYTLAGFSLDRFGRWKTIFAFALCLGFAQIFTVFAPNYIAFCAARLISGFSSMPLQSSSYTLLLEFLSPKKRKLVGASTAIFWLASAAIFCWVAYYLGDWRILCIISSLPVLFIVLMLRWVPESPSWLLGRGDTQRAIQVLQYVAKMNNRNLSEDANFKLSLLSKVSTESDSSSFLQSSLSLFKFPNIRKKTLTMFLGWILICMSYHGVNLSQTSSGAQVYLIYSLGSVLEIPVCFAHLLLVDRLGRRFLIIVSLITVAVLCPLTSFLTKDSLWVTFGTTIATRGLFSLAYNVFFQMSSELFPTTVRGRGICLMRALGDVGTTIVPYVINLRTIDVVIPTMVFSGMAVIGAFLTLILPETLNQPLPQTLEDAESFGKSQGICFCPAFQWIRNGGTKTDELSKPVISPSTLENGDIQKDFTIHL